MFYYCDNLKSIDFGANFNTSNVTNMKFMFYHCISLTILNLEHFNTYNVEDMQPMFAWCQNLSELDLSGFDTNKAKYMNAMFFKNSKLKTIYVTEGKWSTSQAQITDMFRDCGTSSVTYK